MYLRLLIGRDKGEIKEFPYLIARDLLANGRAEDPYATPSAPLPVQSVMPVAAVPSHARKGGRK